MNVTAQEQAKFLEALLTVPHINAIDKFSRELTTEQRLTLILAFHQLQQKPLVWN